jgi:competence protein ComEA
MMNARGKVHGIGPRFRRAQRTMNEPVDLNRADRDELRAVYGIGDRRAERILQWRHAHGRFRSTDQLREVGAFSDEDVARLRPHLRV